MFSIIIPNYNKKDYLEESINSVKNQSYINWECIIIDDNSNDNSVELIKKITDTDPRFKLICLNENKGANYCRNLGFKHSKYDWIIFLDSDDIISINCLFSRLEFLKTYKYLDFLVFPTATFYKQIGDNKWVWNNYYGDHLNRFLSHDLPWLICSILWSKHILKKLNCFDENLLRLQDVDLHTRALMIKDIKYKTFIDYKSDVFYRIDENRILNHFEFLKKDIRAKLSFVSKFKEIVHKREKYLKGTYFECFNNIFSFYSNDLISKQELTSLNKFIFEKSSFLELNYFDHIILKLYVFIRKFKFYLRGMNKLFKAILIR